MEANADALDSDTALDDSEKSQIRNVFICFSNTFQIYFLFIASRSKISKF